MTQRTSIDISPTQRGGNPALLQAQAPAPAQAGHALLQVQSRARETLSQVALVPAPAGHMATATTAPALAGQNSNSSAASSAASIAVFKRDVTQLEASGEALLSACKDRAGEGLQDIRTAVFDKFAQVSLALPEAAFLCKAQAISQLPLNYLELRSSPDARYPRRCDAQAFNFMERSKLAVEALTSLNALASNQAATIQLGLELASASFCSFSSMLSMSHRALQDALKADKLLVYLKLDSLLQSEEDDSRYLSHLLEILEKHPALQQLVLDDSCIGDSAARDIARVADSVRTLQCIDLRGCTLSPEARQILGQVKSVQVLA